MFPPFFFFLNLKAYPIKFEEIVIKILTLMKWLIYILNNMILIIKMKICIITLNTLLSYINTVSVTH